MLLVSMFPRFLLVPEGAKHDRPKKAGDPPHECNGDPKTLEANSGCAPSHLQGCIAAPAAPDPARHPTVVSSFHWPNKGRIENRVHRSSKSYLPGRSRTRRP